MINKNPLKLTTTILNDNKKSINDFFNRIDTLKQEYDLATDKFDRYYLKKELNLFSSFLLELTKRNIVTFSKDYNDIGDGRIINSDITVKSLIINGRNQSFHFDEKNYNSKIKSFFTKLLEYDLIQKSIFEEEHSYNIITILNWKNYQDIIDDIYEIQSQYKTKPLIKKLLYVHIVKGKFHWFDFIKIRSSEKNSPFIDKIYKQFMQYLQNNHQSTYNLCNNEYFNLSDLRNLPYLNKYIHEFIIMDIVSKVKILPSSSINELSKLNIQKSTMKSLGFYYDSRKIKHTFFSYSFQKKVFIVSIPDLNENFFYGDKIIISGIITKKTSWYFKYLTLENIIIHKKEINTKNINFHCLIQNNII